MKIIRKYTIAEMCTDEINDAVSLRLVYGDIKGAFYDREYPKQEFDTEQEALEYAYERDKYARWIIMPIIRFEDEEI